MTDAPGASLDASAEAAAPDRARGDAAGTVRANISELATTGGDGNAIDTPAREQIAVSDEVLARRLAEELNTTGRKRRAPEPVFVPAPLSGPGGKGKPRTKGPKPRSTGRADSMSVCFTRTKKPRAPKAGREPEDFSEGLLRDDDAMDPETTPRSRASPEASGSLGSDSDDSDDERPLCDVAWRARVPEKELAPPDGYEAGDLVWARLSHRKSTSSIPSATQAVDTTRIIDDANALWWPGRVWKLRNCQHIEKLWRNRGAPPSTRVALVRCFGDGSFAWAKAEALAPFHVPGERTNSVDHDVETDGGDGRGGRDALSDVLSDALRVPERGSEGTSDGNGTRVRDADDERVRDRIRERHDAFAARLLAMATRRSAPKKKGSTGCAWWPPWRARRWRRRRRPAWGAGSPRGAPARGRTSPARKTAGRRKPRRRTVMDGGRKAAREKHCPWTLGMRRARTSRGRTARRTVSPDWVIDAGCRVFELNLPTIEAPIIRGLLDPCTNSKRRPNIPAEKTYDKADDGLKQENSWKGFHVILNPSYESSVQWRFINRAINEVEWGFCPGILLVCRNSTDTSYFQRLLPFPRVFLRRDAVMFKDYDHTPIGFGIAVFCLVSPVVPKATKLAIYRRFFDEFHHAGEFNVPFDAAFMEEAAFERLTDRLHVAAATRFRDSWVACDKCDRWREIPPTQSLAQIGASATWRCAFAYPAQGVRERRSPTASSRRSRWPRRGTRWRSGRRSAGRTSRTAPRRPRLRRRRCRWRRTRGRPAPRRRWTRAGERRRGRFAGASGWRKVEKTEDDTRDAGRATR